MRAATSSCSSPRVGAQQPGCDAPKYANRCVRHDADFMLCIAAELAVSASREAPEASDLSEALDVKSFCGGWGA